MGETDNKQINKIKDLSMEEELWKKYRTEKRWGMLNWEAYNLKMGVREGLTEKMESNWEPTRNLGGMWFRKREQHWQRPWGSVSGELEK